LGVELAIRDLFGHPVLRELAQVLSSTSRTEWAPIEVISRAGVLPLFLSQQPEASRAYHIGGTLRLRGELDRSALRVSLERIVSRHEVLRTRFVTVDGEPVQ